MPAWPFGTKRPLHGGGFRDGGGVGDLGGHGPGTVRVAVDFLHDAVHDLDLDPAVGVALLACRVELVFGQMMGVGIPQRSSAYACPAAVHQPNQRGSRGQRTPEQGGAFDETPFALTFFSQTFLVSRSCIIFKHDRFLLFPEDNTGSQRIPEMKTRIPEGNDPDADQPLVQGG